MDALAELRHHSPRRAGGGEVMGEEVITDADIEAASEWAWQLAEQIVLGNHGCGNAAVLIDRALARRIEAEREAVPIHSECPHSYDGRHHVDTSMEEGPNNCFHCGVSMAAPPKEPTT